LSEFVEVQETFCIDEGMGGCLLVVPPGTKATSTKYPLSERRERRTNWRRCSYPFVFATILHVPRIAIKNLENNLKRMLTSATHSCILHSA